MRAWYAGEAVAPNVADLYETLVSAAQRSRVTRQRCTHRMDHGSPLNDLDLSGQILSDLYDLAHIAVWKP